MGERNFFEICCEAPLEVCEERDPKGLYKKARASEIKGFTGIDATYEPPEKPETVVRTDQLSPQEATITLAELLNSAGKLPSSALRAARIDSVSRRPDCRQAP